MGADVPPKNPDFLKTGEAVGFTLPGKDKA